ncbi:MAG: Crp/Fnr family transcriptional regulator [Bacteroidota bacterium]
MYHKILQAYFRRIIAFSPAEMAAILSYYKEKKVAKGAYLLQRGQICQLEGFVVAGCFKISTVDEKGLEKVLYFAARDWWVMEIDSFANRTASSLDIQALEDSTILYTSEQDKEKLSREVPKVERLFRIIYQKAIVAWQRRLMRNQTMNAEERYHYFITTYPEINELVTNKLIASYLGITQEFLSMIRKRRATRKS